MTGGGARRGGQPGGGGVEAANGGGVARQQPLATLPLALPCYPAALCLQVRLQQNHEAEPSHLRGRIELASRGVSRARERLDSWLHLARLTRTPLLTLARRQQAR